MASQGWEDAACVRGAAAADRHPWGLRRPHRRWPAAALAALLGLLLVGAAKPGEAAVGLDFRPSNTTCVARPVSVANQYVRAVPAFPNLLTPFIGPTDLRQHPQDGNRWYVSERGGRIWTLNGAASSGGTVALDLRHRMRFTATDLSASQQWGITSFVFHFAWGSGQPYLFVAYNARPAPGRPVVSRLSRFASYDNGATFDPFSELVLLARPQSSVWHHFGQLQNGPEGLIYLGSGDGAAKLPNPEAERAQSWASLYGGILRVNPWFEKPVLGNGIDIFAKGLRNPWRFTFDRWTNELWVGDVGEDSWEEINQLGAGSNAGWPVYEGPECRRGNCPPASNYTSAVHAFDHSEGSAAIGGLVYRGNAIPALFGAYLFGAASHPRLWALTNTSPRFRIDIGQLPRGMPTGFYQDYANEPYVLDAILNNIWKLVKGPGAAATADALPQLLSQTGCVDPVRPWIFASGVIPFDVVNPLWSDGADKKRGLAIPDGQTIRVRPNGDFDLPSGSVLLKTFSINRVPVETRLLLRHPNGGGWRGYSYEWVGRDAQLLTGAKAKMVGSQAWVFPSREQCNQCHTPAAGASLSLELAQVNLDFTYPSTGRRGNQVETYQHIGLFANALPPQAAWPRLAERTIGTLEQRSRSYLHANCSFCHRPGGGAQANLDLRYWVSLAATNSCNQPPLTTNLGIPGAALIVPGRPDLSILPLRARRRDVYGMPPLASVRPDTAMVATINLWIGSLAGCP